MKITEANFQVIVRYGGIALAISCIASIYLVMRHIEVYRDAARATAQYQQAVIRQQALQGVLQDFLVRAKTDPKVLEILERNQVIAVSSNELGKAQGVKP
jgi:hypothetical protein